jgi:hypothetical protein
MDLSRGLGDVYKRQAFGWLKTTRRNLRKKSMPKAWMA